VGFCVAECAEAAMRTQRASCAKATRSIITTRQPGINDIGLFS
jgi:hypothetical protein